MGGVVANSDGFDVLGLHKYEGEFHFIVFDLLDLGLDVLEF